MISVFFGGSANAAVAARIPVISYLLDRYNVSRGGNIIRFATTPLQSDDLVIEEPSSQNVAVLCLLCLLELVLLPR
jgi:hypothetical protein